MFRFQKKTSKVSILTVKKCHLFTDSAFSNSNTLQDHEFFMATAVLAAKCSKDPKTQVGAVIVNSENFIVGIGYNKFPKDLEFSWGKKEKHKYVVHAEANALMHRNCENLKNATIFTTLSPCIQCAQLIIKSGITKVIYKDYKPGKNDQYGDALSLLNENGVESEQFKSNRKLIPINLNHQEKPPRNDFWNLKDYFMSLAVLVSKCSKEFYKTGAVFVTEHNQIMAMGYNELPLNSLDKYYNNSEDAFMIHATYNAIINANIGQLKNAHLYITRYPCNECAKFIVESGVKKIYFLEEQPDEASRLMFLKANVKTEKYESSVEFNLNV